MQDAKFISQQLRENEKTMIQAGEKRKEIPDLRESVRKELLVNAIVMFLLVLGGWWLIFSIWGEPKEQGSLLGFMACMIPIFTVLGE